MSVNKVILLGHIGADPEIRYPEPDRPIAFMSLATNDRYANSTTEITEWHRLVMGGPNARLAENYTTLCGGADQEPRVYGQDAGTPSHH